METSKEHNEDWRGRIRDTYQFGILFFKSIAWQVHIPQRSFQMTVHKFKLLDLSECCDKRPPLDEKELVERFRNTSTLNYRAFYIIISPWKTNGSNKSWGYSNKNHVDDERTCAERLTQLTGCMRYAWKSHFDFSHVLTIPMFDFCRCWLCFGCLLR